jgi:hypothetical protein
MVGSPKKPDRTSGPRVSGAMRGARMASKRMLRRRRVRVAADNGDHIKDKKIPRATAGRASGSTAQSALARPKRPKKNISWPKLEANDRVEGITGGDDRLALVNALDHNRWNRRHKLLPNLKLEYPSDDESQQIVKLAKVKDASYFVQKIRSIILDAHLSHQSFSELSIPQVRKMLKRVVAQANKLKNILSKLDVGRGSKGSENVAGWLIERDLAFQQFELGRMILLPQFIELLHGLNSAAQRAAEEPIHVQKGAGGNPAFDAFIESLVMSARMLGGKWTIYRSRDDTWTGTLLEALQILKKYLPQNFFPKGKLGRSVEHIRKKLNKHIERAPMIRI